MNTLIALIGDKIYFNPKRMTVNGCSGYTLGLDTLAVPQGIYFPMTHIANEFLSLIEGNPIDTRSMSPDVAGLLVTHRGHIYKYIRMGRHYAVQRLLWGPGTVMIMSDVDEMQQAMTVALHLTKGSVKKALHLVDKDLYINASAFVVYEIPKIISTLIECGLTEDIRWIEPMGATKSDKSLVKGA